MQKEKLMTRFRLTVLSGVFLLSIPSLAWGGGLDIGDNGPRSVGRGGAYSAAVNEPSAIYYSPAAISQIEGFAVTVNANLWFYNALFQRAPYTAELLEGYENTYEFAPAENDNSFFPAPMLFVSHDFGLEDWGFGVGAYGPPAIGNFSFSAPELDRLANISTDDPSERDFGHGYLMEEEDMMLIYFSAAVAYDFGPLQAGVTLQLGWLSTLFTNGADGGGVSDSEADSIEEPSLYTRNTLEVSGVTPTVIVGLRAQPIDPLTLSLSYRPRHSFSASGDLAIEFPPALEDLVALTESGAHLEMTMPDVVRFGARWAFLSGGSEVADIELDIVYEAWSLTEQFDITFDGKIDLSIMNEQRRLPSVVMLKRFNDTLSFRLGGDVHVTDALTVRAGASYEGAANSEFFSQGSTAPGYANIDFMPFRRIGVGLGGSYAIGDWTFDLAWMHIFSPEFEETEGNVDVLFPLWVCQDPQLAAQQAACDERTSSPFHAVNNGSYEVSYDLLSVGVTLNFK